MTSNTRTWLQSLLVTMTLGLMVIPVHGQVPMSSAATQGIRDKSDLETYDKVLQQLSDTGRTRVIVRLRTDAEPAANLDGNQARSKTARAARKLAIKRLMSTFSQKLPRSSSAVPLHAFKHLPYVVMELDAATLASLATLTEVESIRIDRLFEPTLSNSVVQMGADIAHIDGYTGAGNAVAVLDTGVDVAHSAFGGKVITEACFSTASVASSSFSLCPNGSNPGGEDSQFGPGAADNCDGLLGCDHGTHVAGIVLSSDPVFSGVAPDADLVAVQVFSGLTDLFDCGFFPPCLSSFTSDVVRGLEWVYDERDNLPITVVNMSLGGEFYTTQAECDAAYPGVKDAIANLRSVGIATVVASGNDGVAGALSTPACVTGAVSVGAVDAFDQVASFTNTADFLTTLTPGVDIVSSVPGGNFAVKSGTSMAAPHAAGAFAVLNSAKAGASVDEIVDAITQTGVPITDPIGGFVTPRIQLDEAVDLLRGPQLSDVNLALQPVISGLNEPVAITHANDGSGRLFIAEANGLIRIYDGQNLLSTPYLDLSSVVSCCASAGILAMAFHPLYATNGQLFVNFIDTAGNISIMRYEVSSNPDSAAASTATAILNIPNPGGDHYGGQIQFGTDGYLYVAVGDGSQDGQVVATAEDPTTLLGKLLRINVDGALPYTIPVDNPFVGDTGTLDEIWALGLRDPWRFSFDRLTGDLLIADSGEDTTEEVNFQAFDSIGGEDYGWSRMEGSQCFGTGSCDTTGLTLPIAEYAHDLETCAVTGGHVYRGQLDETLNGVYLYGDFCSGEVHGLLFDGTQWQSQSLLETPYQIITFGEDEDGNIYLADFASGQIFLAKTSDLSIATVELANAVINRTYQQTLSVDGGVAPYSWSLIDGALPPGLTLNTTTGQISGASTALGSQVFTVKVTDAELASVTQELVLTTTTPPPIIQTTEFPRGDVGEQYAVTIALVDGTGPFVWSVSSGALPPGLTLDATTGTVSGTPSTVGQFAFDVSVTDASQLSDTASYTLEVVELVQLIIGTLETGQYGHQYGSNNHLEELSATFTGTGQDLIFTLDGYDIDYNDEVSVSLNGTFLGFLTVGPNNNLNVGDTFILPQALLSPGENELSIKQVGSVGFIWGATNLLLVVPASAPTIDTTSLPDGEKHVAYSATLSASGSVPPYSWTLTSGLLPDGITLSSVGLLSGTPTEGGTFDFEVTATDALNQTATQALTLLITTVDVALTVGMLETGQYGNKYGTNVHEFGISFLFDSTGADLLLTLDGYDIDFANEVSVSLNGVFLGYLSKGPNNSLNSGDSFVISALDQISGQNVILVDQALVRTYKWGATNILLQESSSEVTIETTTLPDGEKGQPYTESLIASGGTSPIAWTLASGLLPEGITLSSVGLLSGTPTEGGTFNFEVTATDALNQTASQALTLLVTTEDVALTVGVLETGQYGNKYGTDVHEFGIPLVFESTGADLLLTLDGYDIDFVNEVSVSLNGVFLGYLSTGPNNNLNSGDSFAIPALDQISGQNVILVDQALVRTYKWGATNILLQESSTEVTIETTTLPDAEKGQPYTESLIASGGTSPIAWTLTSGLLPEGITLSSAGLLSGPPTEGGTFNFEVTATDVFNQTASQALTLLVTTVDVALTVGTLDTGQYGHQYGASLHLEEVVATFVGTGEDLLLSVSGYDIDYADEVSVSFNGSFLGYLSVGPNNQLNAGDTFVLPLSQQVTTGNNEVSFRQALSVGYIWGVSNLLVAPPSPPVITTSTLNDAQTNESYTTTLSVSGGLPPYTWSVVSGSLPSGMTLSSSGVLSGTTTQEGSHVFEVEVIDSLGLSDTQSLTLIANGFSVALTIGTLETGQYGNKYGTNVHEFGIPLVFDSTGVDLLLTLDGYDIDFANEVSVSLNGVFLGYLRRGPNNNLNSGDSFAIPALDQIPGQNIILVDQALVRAYKWGATNILLDVSP